MAIIRNNKNTYSDLDLTLTVNPNTKDFSVLLDDNAVKRTIRHILQLEKYDIPFDNTKYSNIKKTLFEPVTFITASVLESQIKYILNRIDNRIKVLDVSVNANSAEDGFDVYIFYNIVYFENNSKLHIFLQRVR
jgi:phage baseplate assembly protein W